MVYNCFHTAWNLPQHCKGLPANVRKIVLCIDNASADVLDSKDTKAVRMGSIYVNTDDVVERTSILSK